jgi:hypothetical protein
MKKTGIWLTVLVCFWVMNLGALDDSVAETKKAGTALLNAYVRSFQEMAAQGASRADLENRLRAMAADAKKAKEAGEVNLVFYSRYARLLAMTKLMVQPDEGNILVPVIDREVRDFLLDVTGEEPIAYKAGGPRAVGQVANAMAEEIINLQIYLDTLDKREAMRKKFDEGMTESLKK